MIDKLNADHTRGQVEPDDFTRSTQSITFYDSVIVFERGEITLETTIRVGGQMMCKKIMHLTQSYKEKKLTRRFHHMDLICINTRKFNLTAAEAYEIPRLHTGK